MDDADIAEGLIQGRSDKAVAEARILARTMPVGKPGDCDLCGEWSQRLVGGACAPCRDRFKLK